jgi:uncharacterized protein (TIGR03437 family)
MLAAASQSTNTVSQAVVLANTIVGDFDWSASAYHGAADNSGPSLAAAAVVSDLNGLANNIQQAVTEFNQERDLFNPTTTIATQLQAALYFTRANQALAVQTGPSQSLRAHLERIIGHLSVAEDLLLDGVIAPETAQLASSVGARTDLIIGALNSGYSPAANGLAAPGSLGSIFGDAVSSPLSKDVVFARLSADGTLPYELSGVSVSVGGHAVPIFYVSPTRVTFFVPTDLPVGDSAVVVVSQAGYVSTGTLDVMRNVTRVMTLGEDDAGTVLGVNDARQVMESYSVISLDNFGTDKRTRLSFFATGITGSAANTDSSNDVRLGAALIQNYSESVVVEAHTLDGRVYQLPVEFAGPQGFPGLDQVNVILIPELQGAGTVDLTLIVNGQRSNAPTITVR